MNLHTIVVILFTLSLTGCILPPISEQQPNEPPYCEPVTIVKEKSCPVFSCPEPKVIEKVVTKKIEVPVEVPAKKGGPLDLPIIGEREMVTIDPANLFMEARVDTGAETSSIHAENIQLIERDEKRYVQFNLFDQEGKPHQLERRLKRKVLIKQHEGESERRFVVKLWVSLGNIRELIEFTLTDRDNFEFPVLLGRNFLTDLAIVDVSRKHLIELAPKQASNMDKP